MASAGGKEAALAAFEAYDWDAAEFSAHLRNVELPPAAPAAALLKVKAKWFKREVDPDFDVSWVQTSSSSSSSSQQQQQPAAAAAASPPRAQPQQQPAAGRSAAWKTGRSLHIGILQALILVAALPALLSTWAYGKLTMVLLASQVLQVHTKLGGPGAWTLPALQAWLARLTACPEGQLLMLAFLASINKPAQAIVPVFAVPAAYRLVGLLDGGLGGSALWRRFGAPLAAKMAAGRQSAELLAARAEITLLFSLVVKLLTPGRAPMFAYGTAQFLRLRYWSADVGPQHRAVWAALDEKTAGLRQRFPLLQRIVGFGVMFFHQQQQQPHARTD